LAPASLDPQEAGMPRSRGSLALSIVVAAVAFSAPNRASGQDMHRSVGSDALTWVPGPPSMPKGQMVAVLAGDPGKSGIFILRAKLPDGYVVPPHWHRQSEHLTVLSGQLHVGMGEKFDRSKGETIGPGGFVTMPANMRHYVWISGETVLQVTSMGPFDITYINSKDDPRNAVAEKK
jgi:mannose-6-phosphate isomerase-like protein (cupin superfamily)